MFNDVYAAPTEPGIKSGKPRRIFFQRGKSIYKHDAPNGAGVRQIFVFAADNQMTCDS